MKFVTSGLYLFAMSSSLCETLGGRSYSSEVSLGKLQKEALMGDQREFDLETRVITNGNNKSPRCFTVVH